jgi:hypothetical protein
MARDINVALYYVRQQTTTDKNTWFNTANIMFNTKLDIFCSVISARTLLIDTEAGDLVAFGKINCNVG